jgi:cytidylate kinase
MTRAVICISHQTGAGGPELASEIADRLGYHYVDEEVVVQAARHEGLTVEALADVERRKSFLSRIMADFGRSQVGMLGAYGIPVDVMDQVTDPNALRALIRRSIEEIAAGGSVVMVSHAASYALGRSDDVLRVMVVAPRDRRIAKLAAANDVDERAAEKAIDEHDAARADYVKRFYSVDAELPSDYDLVVNTDGLGPSLAASLVVAAAS